MPESAATGTGSTNTAGNKPSSDSTEKSISKSEDTRKDADKKPEPARPAAKKQSPRGKSGTAPKKKAAKSSDSTKRSVPTTRDPKRSRTDTRKRKPATPKTEYSAADFKRAKARMGGIDPDRVKECKTVEDLDALHLEARGHRIPGLNPPELADQSGNGTVQSTKADGSIVNYDASEKGWQDDAFEGTSKQVSAKD